MPLAQEYVHRANITSQVICDNPQRTHTQIIYIALTGSGDISFLMCLFFLPILILS